MHDPLFVEDDFLEGPSLRLSPASVLQLEAELADHATPPPPALVQLVRSVKLAELDRVSDELEAATEQAAHQVDTVSRAWLD